MSTLPAFSPDYERLQTAVDAAGVGTWDLNPATGELVWSTRCKELFGLPPTATITYDEFLRGLHPDDRPATEAAVGQALDPTGSGTYDIEYRTVGLEDGGRVRWVRATGRTFFDATHTQPLRFIGTITDITRQKQVQETLRQSEERYALAALATNDAIWEWNLQTNEVKWNPAVERVLGYGPEARTTTAEWWYQHIHPADAERVVHGIHEAIDGGRTDWHDEYRFQRADGSYASMMDRGHVARGAQGQPLRMIGAMQDVTRQREAEKALRQREADFTTMADTIAQLAWMAEPDGNITWYNRRWYEYTGTTQEEMLGWGWEKVHHPEHVGRVLEFVRAAWPAGQPWELTFPLRGHQGQYRWFLTRAVPIRNEQGQVLRWFGTNTDITELKQLQEQLERSYQDLELKVTFRTLTLEREVQQLRAQIQPNAPETT
ncbi:PAS domain-containing protein [Hymenobacter sp. HSC-4F20]|uniref:PAS domain-containing protein n=1 Tax=Hymenobacter sp. HSC-4F20 TaxID=2864135 RepID=UPI001C72FD19|nr:PAS domain-containing protein [Hymenobacter sp. HSC-4F20]MBX0290331.1 PAS domain-containing protein [Hymenobacter sp. HSC-4F20]